MAQKARKEHHAFRIEYQGIVTALIVPCEVFIPEQFRGKEFLFIWDTGATNSVITQEVVESLGLIQMGNVIAQGVNSTTEVPTYVVDIGLPNNVLVKDVKVTGSTIGGDDAVNGLIGMDIIGLGDMAVSNGGGKTLFTFAVPPFENPTDYVQKANRLMPKK